MLNYQRVPNIWRVILGHRLSERCSMLLIPPFCSDWSEGVSQKECKGENSSEIVFWIFKKIFLDPSHIDWVLCRHLPGRIWHIAVFSAFVFNHRCPARGDGGSSELNQTAIKPLAGQQNPWDGGHLGSFSSFSLSMKRSVIRGKREESSKNLQTEARSLSD